MTLLGKLGLSPESQALEGEPDDVAARVKEAHLAKLRPARVQVARSNLRWREVEETDLVRRDHYFVHAASDEVFLPLRGAVFERDSIVVLNDQAEYWFFVDAADELHFLERQSRRWSDIVAVQAAKQLRRTAERPTPEWMKP